MTCMSLHHTHHTHCAAALPPLCLCSICRSCLLTNARITMRAHIHTPSSTTPSDSHPHSITHSKSLTATQAGSHIGVLGSGTQPLTPVSYLLTNTCKRTLSLTLTRTHTQSPFKILAATQAGSHTGVFGSGTQLLTPAMPGTGGIAHGGGSSSSGSSSATIVAGVDPLGHAQQVLLGVMTAIAPAHGAAAAVSVS